MTAIEEGGARMTAEGFRRWRRSLGLDQAAAAELLGVSRRMVQYYERGDRGGRPVEIPKPVRLACWALAAGVVDFDGVAPERGGASPGDRPHN